MNCEWIAAARQTQENCTEYQCKHCLYFGTDCHGHFPDRIYRECTKTDRPLGPGHHLESLLRTMGFTEGLGCGCNDFKRKMEQWGIQGCKDNKNAIREWLKEKKQDVSLSEMLIGGLAGLLNGQPLTIDGLINEAIRRAEQDTIEYKEH